MNIRSKLSLAVITIGIAISAVGCSFTPNMPVVSASPIISSASATPEPTISASAEAKIPVAETKVVTVASPPAATPPPPVAVEPVSPAPSPVVATPAAPVPAAAPQPAPEQVPVVVPLVTAPAVSREVYVGLAGGQSEIDLQRGPVLFTLPAGFPPYVTEHDLAGGWERFGTLSAGMTVRMSGLVTGTYTVGQIINVPKHGTTDEFSKFSVMPKVMLQTCVPGTQRMIIVGLY